MDRRLRSFTVACAALGLGAVAPWSSALAEPTDAEIELWLDLDDALEALAEGDTADYEDRAEALLVQHDAGRWMPEVIVVGLEDGDVMLLELTLSYLGAPDEFLAEAAVVAVQSERDLIEILADGPAPELADAVETTDLLGLGVLQTAEHRGYPLPEAARSVLRRLPPPSADDRPTLADYDAAIAALGGPVDDIFAPSAPPVSLPSAGSAATPTTAPPAAPTTVPATTPTSAPSTAGTAPTTPVTTAPTVAVTAAPATGDGGPGDAAPATVTSGTTGSSTTLLTFGTAGAALVSLAIGGFALLRSRRHDHLADLAYTDGLTGLRNRRRFDVDVAASAAAGARPTAMLMVDIDHFKALNDTHGHAAGDDALRLVGAAIAQTIRRTDVAYRYGGEEFSVLLPDTGRDEAVATAERVRSAIGSIVLPSIGRITASVGVSVGPAEALDLTIRRADEALYEAKALGRDCVATS